jgi:hypothetical protein
MPNRSQPVRELTLDLEDADELFAAREPDVASGMPGMPSGIERIREELDASSLPESFATVILLPPAKVQPGLACDVGRAVERYCDMGIARAQNEIKMLRREGIRTFLIGLSLFIVFVSIAEALEHTGLPEVVRNVLGTDGLFLVVGWVGLWYPIETLLYTPRPHRQEIAVLRAMRGMRIEVRAAGQ